MKLHQYLDIDLSNVKFNNDEGEFEFHPFRIFLSRYGLEFNWDDNVYCIKHNFEDNNSRRKLNKGLKFNVFNKKILEIDGILVRQTDNEILCYTFPTDRVVKLKDELPKNPLKYLGYYPAITPDEIAEFDPSQYRYQKMVDGFLIRLYHDGTKWKLGTHHHSNAEKSIWTSGRSFHQLFMETGKWYNITQHENLNPSHCYSFVLCHPDHQQVYRHKEIQLYHISSRDMETMEEIEVDLDIPKMDYIDDIEKPIQTLERMYESENPNEGILILNKNNNERIPVMSSKHQRLLRIRGNYQNMQYRCVELIMERDESVIEDFKTYFEEYAPFVEEFQKQFKQIVELLFRKYNAKYNMKHRLDASKITKEEQQILGRLYYELKMENNLLGPNERKKQMTRKRITDYLYSLSPETIAGYAGIRKVY